MKDMADWGYKYIDEMAVIDQASLGAETKSDYLFYYIDISAVSEGKLRLPSSKTIFREAPSRARKIVRRGDVLMSTVRPNLKAFAFFDHTNEDCIASTGFAVLTARDQVDPRFILYSILSDAVTAQIEALVVGSNYPAINSNAVRRLKVVAPPYAEQTKIAEILSTVDRAVEQTEALIAKQQRIKTGLMQDLLTRGIDEHGNLRSEKTHKFKDSPLGRIPAEWEVAPLKEFVLIKHGYAFAGEFFTDQRNENVLLTPGNFNVQGGLYFTEDNTKYYNGAVPEEYILSNGDVLVVMTDLTKEMAILGRTVILHHPDKVLHNQRIGKVEVKRGSEMDTGFLALLMNSDYHRNSIKATATGTTVRHTSPEKLLSPLIPIVSLDEQIRIWLRIDTIEESIRSTDTKLAKTLRLKTALMQDLLRGKKRVTALLNNTEVANV